MCQCNNVGYVGGSGTIRIAWVAASGWYLARKGSEEGRPWIPSVGGISIGIGERERVKSTMEVTSAHSQPHKLTSSMPHLQKEGEEKKNVLEKASAYLQH